MVGFVSLMLLVGYSPCSELMAAVMRLDALKAGACGDTLVGLLAAYAAQ